MSAPCISYDYETSRPPPGDFQNHENDDGLGPLALLPLSIRPLPLLLLLPLSLLLSLLLLLHTMTNAWSLGGVAARFRLNGFRTGLERV